MLIPSRRVWTDQPQHPTGIDWSHPLASGLILAFNGGNGTTELWHNDAPGGNATKSTIGRTIGYGPNGRHVAPASGVGASFTVPDEGTPTSITRAVLINSFVGGGTRTVFCGGHNNGSLELNGSNQFGIWLGSLGALTSALTSGPMLLSMSGKSGSWRTFVNGVFQNSATTNTSVGKMTAIGGGSGFSSQGFSAALILGWQDRFFSDDEHKALFDAIWPLFYPDEELLPFPDAGGIAMPVLSAPSFAGRVPSVTITH